MDGAPDKTGHAAVTAGEADPASFLSSPLFDDLSPPLIRWVADRRGHISVRDAGAASLADRFAYRLVGREWRKLLHPHDHRAVLGAALRGGGGEPLAIRFAGREGVWVACLLRVARLADGGGCYGTVEEADRACELGARAVDALDESREHYRWAVALSPQVPWTASPDGLIEEVGPRWLSLTGMEPGRALGWGWMDALHPDDMTRAEGEWRAHLRSGAPLDMDYRVRTPDGDYCWMRARAGARRDAKGRIIRWYGTLENVQVHKLAQEALAQGEERFRLAVQSANLGIWDFNCLTNERTWSRELRRMLGVTVDEPATSELALSLVHDDDRHRLRRLIDAVAQQRPPAHFEDMLRIRRADDGAERWIRSSGWTTQSESGRLSRVIVTFRDVTEEQDAERRIRWAATHDPMTRMPNRSLWQEALEQHTLTAQLIEGSFGLLLLDIDDLKRVNDGFGHDAGDALLLGFAERLAEAVPEDAVIGRLGGDEFGLISPSLVDSASLAECSARLLERVRGPYPHNGRDLECGVSIGGAVYGEHGATANDLLKAADLALYASKRSGRGRMTLFQSEFRASAQRESSMLFMAEQALALNLVLPYYQPKVCLRTGRVLGFEALLRWRHPKLGIQPPATIAAAFDHAELAMALTERMLTMVVSDVAIWLEAGMDPGRIAINAAAADFLTGDFADRLLGRLAQANIPTRHFEVEVTETVFLGRGAEQVERALHRFADAGVRVALDDFGTGYASLSHVKQYPVEVLKIDRSFIANIDRDPGDAAIVDAILKLGSSLGIEVVAEGIETREQADRLMALGCFIGQGYYYGQPRPPQELRHAIRAHG